MYWTTHHPNMADCVWLCQCAPDSHQHHQTLLQEQQQQQQQQGRRREKLHLRILELFRDFALLFSFHLDYSRQLLGVWILRLVATVQCNSRSKLLLPPGPLLVFLCHTGRDLCYELHLLLRLLLCIHGHRLCCSSWGLAGTYAKEQTMGFSPKVNPRLGHFS